MATRMTATMIPTMNCTHPLEKIAPAITSEAMPMRIVTIQPMGSTPGWKSRPSAPTIAPTMISHTQCMACVVAAQRRRKRDRALNRGVLGLAREERDEDRGDGNADEGRQPEPVEDDPGDDERHDPDQDRDEEAVRLAARVQEPPEHADDGADDDQPDPVQRYVLKTGRCCTYVRYSPSRISEPTKARISPPGRPKRTWPIRPPTIEPPRPSRIVCHHVIGSGPGSAQRASPPTMKPQTAARMIVRSTAGDYAKSQQRCRSVRNWMCRFRPSGYGG